MFPSGHQWFLERYPSDHRPVLVKFMGESEPLCGQFRITKLREELEEEEEERYPWFTRIAEIKIELAIAYCDEEIFWRQKSREKWLREGDRNTKFFQASVKSTRAKNSLQFLLDEHEREQFSNRDKSEVAVRYFSDLFKTSSPTSFTEIFSDFLPRVTDAMNDGLTCDVTLEEVRLAFFSIESEKTPGHDGMTGFFYKKYWEIVKHQLFVDV
ncbi:unnamed protein product [Microthlaspi erraticum]|uniref:Reverse transcriptase domain-containing protein n=1 Tax=Microthlaspi erraticum TaxID=1685480 RepID=A0A6D2IC55_9BRAS|nr:unnamed protein product [Microthlaspi erraticum]